MTPLRWGRDSRRVSGTRLPASANRRLPVPATTGCTSSLSSSSRCSASRNRTRVALAPTEMSWPGCCLSSVKAAVMWLLITLVGPQSGFASVVETTTFGVAVISPACGGAAGPVNTPRNSS